MAFDVTIWADCKGLGGSGPEVGELGEADCEDIEGADESDDNPKMDITGGLGASGNRLCVDGG
jgi:hypothetical protein